MKQLIALIIIVACALAGCTTKMGGFYDKSKFAYPNSNITPLGMTSAETTKFSFIIPPSWSKNDIDTLYAKALKKYPDADLLINYKSDTSTTFPLLPIIVWSTVTIEGTAAKMVVGKKDLTHD